MPIAQVEPLTTARALRGPFDYRVPDSMTGVGVGSVLEVPFGRRRVLGVVVGLTERSELPPERLAEPIEALEAGATPELVRLGLWVAREYCSTPSRGLQLVLPPGTGASGSRTRPRQELLVGLTADGRAALNGGGRLGARQRAIAAELADAGERTLAELAERCGADRAAVRRLEDRGLVRTHKRGVERRPAIDAVGARDRRVEPTPEQRRAISALGGALDGASPRELLLHGVTGSGKTEVYMAAAEAALDRGRGVIVLVPEIGLTPQTVARFAQRFGDRVALLHSGLGAGERYDEWRRLRSGAAAICVGPRSAVFAPVRDLGLVVIDEEHDPSYKQESDPRYDARAVARRRAVEADAVLCAGTATPRPESWLELSRLELPRRVDGATLPPVDVVDMRAEGGISGPIHPRAMEAIAEVRRLGGKAIVLLNRRGWSPHLSCRSCGHAFGCPHCDVSLVLHRSAGRLRCHHCGHDEPQPGSCPQCGSVSVARHGAGTERLESLLSEVLEPLPVFRLDSDSASRRGGHLAVLREFDRAGSGVLLGTQMVAKGHDFPAVALSVVVDADATLRFPDFRAEERTFALVAQLAGRCGRGQAGGRVLVQTLAPGAASIRAAASHDASGFLAEELERRRALRYPPYSHLVSVLLSADDSRTVEAAATRLRARVEASLPQGTELLGPAPMLRTANRHRRRLLLKAEDRAGTIAGVREAVEAAARGGDLRGSALSVDVDPQ